MKYLEFHKNLFHRGAASLLPVRVSETLVLGLLHHEKRLKMVNIGKCQYTKGQDRCDNP